MQADAGTTANQGRLQEAIGKYEECLQLDEFNAQYNASILRNLAVAHVRLKQNDEAVTALNRAIQYQPLFAEAFVMRAEIHVLLEEYNEAIKDFGEAQAIDPEGVNVQDEIRDAQEKLSRAPRKDYYKILGLESNKCSEAQIRKAYKITALKWHPDKNAQNEE